MIENYAQVLNNTRSILRMMLYNSRPRNMLKKIFLERETKLLKHVSNRKQRGKFDLNLKEREREGTSSSLGMLGLWSPLVESGETIPLQQ